MILLNSPAKPRAILFGALAGLLLTSGAPAIAQDNDEARIRKLEAEVRALQRQVFPGGDGRYFEPDIRRPRTEGRTLRRRPLRSPIFSRVSTRSNPRSSR